MASFVCLDRFSGRNILRVDLACLYIDGENRESILIKRGVATAVSSVAQMTPMLMHHSESFPSERGAETGKR